MRDWKHGRNPFIGQYVRCADCGRAVRRCQTAQSRGQHYCGTCAQKRKLRLRPKFKGLLPKRSGHAWPV